MKADTQTKELQIAFTIADLKFATHLFQQPGIQYKNQIC